jgi:hypothetical protein
MFRPFALMGMGNGLVVKMIFTIVIEKTIGVIHPARLGREMVLGTEWFRIRGLCHAISSG